MDCAYMYLDRAKRRRAVEIGALRTDDAIRFGVDGFEAGADGLLLAPVSYTALGGDEVFQHFRAVAQRLSGVSNRCPRPRTHAWPR